LGKDYILEQKCWSRTMSWQNRGDHFDSLFCARCI